MGKVSRATKLENKRVYKDIIHKISKVKEHMKTLDNKSDAYKQCVATLILLKQAKRETKYYKGMIRWIICVNLGLAMTYLPIIITKIVELVHAII